MTNSRDTPAGEQRSAGPPRRGTYPPGDQPLVEAATPADGVETDRGHDAGIMSFARVPRLQLDELLEQLRDAASEFLTAQGRLRGLVQAQAKVASALDLPVVLRRIVESSRELLDARYAALSVVGRDGRLEQFVHSGMDDQTVARIGALPRGRGVLGLLIEHPEPVRLSRIADHPAAAGFPPGHPPMTTFLGVPLRSGQEVLGNLYVTERYDGCEFTQEDQALAEALAVTAAAAIANARLFGESELRRRWLAAAGELTHRLLRSADEPLELIPQEAAIAADADFATLTTLHDDEHLLVKSVYGVIAEELLGRTTSLDSSLAGKAIRTGEPLLVKNYDAEATSLSMRTEIGSAIVIPLGTGEHMHGALTLGRVLGRPGFSETDLSLLTTFGNHAAVALELMAARVDQIQLAQMEDHDRIARDLHDHVIQEVFAVGIGLQGLTSSSEPQVSERIMGYVEALDRVITRIRATIFRLHLGPEYGTLESRLLEIAAQHTPQLGFAPVMDVSAVGDDAVPESLADDLLAVTRESLSNCARHAHASSVEVHLDVSDGVVRLDVVDNGRGIGDPSRSSGLTHMRQRAERHGGTLDISAPADGGTHLVWTARVP